MSSTVRAPDAGGLRPVGRSAGRGGSTRCLLVGMQGFLVVLVPVLIAGFALLMDRFENSILEQPERIDLAPDSDDD